MKKQLHNLASVIAVSLLAGASGVAMAEALETQHSAYELTAQLSAAPMQAGHAGPSEIPGRARAASDWTPLEKRNSAYEFIRETAAAAAAARRAGQAGPAGPSEIQGRAGAASDWTPLEKRNSPYEFIRETAAAAAIQAGRAGP